MLAAALLVLLLQSPAPDISEQQRALARIREYALGYRDSLQNFTCVKVTKRSGDASGKENWKFLETREQELTYLNHRETYRTVRVNGAPVSANNLPKTGFTTIRGEFSALGLIFTASVGATLEWDHAEGSGADRTCVFRYTVAAGSGGGMLFRRGSERVLHGHHGLVTASCETGAVTRLVLNIDPDPGRKSDGAARIEIEYGPVKIGGKEFLLPISALDISHQDKKHTKAEVTFEKYRKYDADSAIRFDGDQ